MSTITYTSSAHPLLRRHRKHWSTHLFFPQTLTLSSKHKSRFPLTVRASLSDPFVLDIAEKLEDSLQLSSNSSVAAPSIPLQKLRESSTQSILAKTWPSSKQEPFRFTDTSFLRRSQILPSTTLPSINLSNFVTPPPISSNSIVIVDGHFAPSVSDISSLPDSVYAGVISDVPAGAVSVKMFGGSDFSTSYLSHNSVREKGKRAESWKINALPDLLHLTEWPLMAVTIEHAIGQKDYLIHKSVWHLNDQSLKNIYTMYIMFTCWGCCYFGSTKDPFYDSDEYRKDGGDGTVHWIYERQEDLEEEARTELLREELIEEIELKVGGLRELDESSKEEELV